MWCFSFVFRVFWVLFCVFRLWFFMTIEEALSRQLMVMLKVKSNTTATDNEKAMLYESFFSLYVVVLSLSIIVKYGTVHIIS